MKNFTSIWRIKSLALKAQHTKRKNLMYVKKFRLRKFQKNELKEKNLAEAQKQWFKVLQIKSSNPWSYSVQQLYVKLLLWNIEIHSAIQFPLMINSLFTPQNQVFSPHPWHSLPNLIPYQVEDLSKSIIARILICFSNKKKIPR